MSRRSNNIYTAIVLCAVCFSFLPKILMYSNNVVEPFTNSIVTLALEAEKSGNIPSIPYTLPGYWQTHANFLSTRGGIVSFLVIASETTGLSPYFFASLPLIGILTVIVGYLFGRALGTRFTGLAFALVFGFSWHPTLTGTNIGYQSYGALLQLFIFFILARSSAKTGKWSAKDILMISLMFVAIYQTYYTAEFTTLALFVVIVVITSIAEKLLRTRIRSLKPVGFLALWCTIIFLAFDSVWYNYLRTSSLRLFGISILSYLSYVRSIIFMESEAIQAYRPYTNPMSKYIDLGTNILTWSIIALSIGLYLYTLMGVRKNATRERTKLENSVHIILTSFIFVFAARLMIYGMLGKIAIGWIYISLIPVALAEIWLFSKPRFRLKYVVPIILISLTIFRFSIIWTDQTLSFIGANYDPMIVPGAQWIAGNTYNGSIVSSNQVSARIFSVVAEFGKAGTISVNQFGSDVDSLTTNATHLWHILDSRGYGYLITLAVFKDQPIFGGFWGPYIPPLGNKLDYLSNCTCFNRVYDDGMSAIHIIR